MIRTYSKKKNFLAKSKADAEQTEFDVWKRVIQSSVSSVPLVPVGASQDQAHPNEALPGMRKYPECKKKTSIFSNGKLDLLEATALNLQNTSIAESQLQATTSDEQTPHLSHNEAFSYRNTPRKTSGNDNSEPEFIHFPLIPVDSKLNYLIKSPCNQFSVATNSLIVTPIDISRILETKLPPASTLRLSILFSALNSCQYGSTSKKMSEELESFAATFNVPISSFQKHGEASYSEVFYSSALNMILKVIPMASETSSSIDSLPIMNPFMAKHEILFSEVLWQKLLENNDRAGDIHYGFLRLSHVALCIGPYDKHLLAARKKYEGPDAINLDPAKYPDAQPYALLFMPDGGVSLEQYDFADKEQVLSFIVQLVFILSHSELLLEFEHRDLHWGNILISKEADGFLRFVDCKQQPVRIHSHGIRTFLIDFSYSRIRVAGRVYFTDLDNEEIFSGDEEMDEQFGIYRKMKQITFDWKEYVPKNNIFWLGYVVRKLKNVKIPKMINLNRRHNRLFVKQLEAFEKSLSKARCVADACGGREFGDLLRMLEV